jgi:hypothetical protein
LVLIEIISAGIYMGEVIHARWMAWIAMMSTRISVATVLFMKKYD